MLLPAIQPPFPLLWGFSTRNDDMGRLHPIRLRQVHGTVIHEALPGPYARIEGDGLWTHQAGLPIGVRTADCVPILLAGLAGDRPWIAALHAGWRGVLRGILGHGVSIYQARGGRPEDLHYAFGPCIQCCHFEVGPEVVIAAQQDAAWSETFRRPGAGDRSHLDLHALLQAQALKLGLDPRKDGSLKRCTRCEPEVFFSFRGGDLEGRQWGWLELP